MKLEENMYVRTKTGIHQIYRIDNNKTKYKYLYKLKKQDGDGCIDCGVLSSEDILKASHSLLGDDKEDGIIEVGDYVNGELVVRIEKDPFIKGQIDLWTNTTTTNYWGDISLSPIIDKNIKSIVTKEQFAAMQYEVQKD